MFWGCGLGGGRRGGGCRGLRGGSLASLASLASSPNPSPPQVKEDLIRPLPTPALAATLPAETMRDANQADHPTDEQAALADTDVHRNTARHTAPSEPEDMYAAEGDNAEAVVPTRYSLDDLPPDDYELPVDPADDVADPHAPLDPDAVSGLDRYEVTDRLATLATESSAAALATGDEGATARRRPPPRKASRATNGGVRRRG